MRRVMVEYLNLLLGDSVASRRYWTHELSDTIKCSFFYHNDAPRLHKDFMLVMKDQV